MRGFLAACVCALLIGACGAQDGGSGAQARPQGWHSRTQGKTTVWIDPSDAKERFAVASTPNQTGTLGQMAARVTIDTLLTHKGARLVKGGPYPGCPGEAGLQSFVDEGVNERSVLRVAYTQWNGNGITAVYARPDGAPDDPAVVNALTRAVCTAVSGTPTLPPIGR